MKMGLSLKQLVEAKLYVRQCVSEAGAVCKREEGVWLWSVCMNGPVCAYMEIHVDIIR